MATQDWRDGFIKHLEKLRDQEDRRALALLRRGLGRDPGTVPEMYSLVVPWVPENRYAEDAAFLVAALFAWHPQAGGQRTLGASFAALVGSNPNSKESFEQRFVSLLNCHHDDLADYLRQAVSLLRSKEIPVNWRQLLQDVLGWDHESRFVQRAWAREFWRAVEQPTDMGETNEEAAEE
jgi:CRISPR system Cascade subunit CasB